MTHFHKSQFILEHDALTTVANILKSCGNVDYYSYERKGIWYIGLESRASIFIDPQGKTATMVISSPVPGAGSKTEVLPVKGLLRDIARDFISK
jgi:hypothetical protein